MSLRRPGSDATGSEWIAVYITHNEQEAHIIAGKLGTYDIPAMIHQEAGAAAIGITLGNLGEVKVLVAPTDYERAAEILYPATADQIEASNDPIQLIWPDEGDAREQGDDDEEE